MEKKLKKLSFFLLLAFVFAIGVGLRIQNLNNVSRRSPDEGIYTEQANIIAKLGNPGLKLMVDEYNAREELWILPPPTRIGYLGLLAGVMTIIDRWDDQVGVYISAVFSICTLLLLVFLGLRFFNPITTLFALLFLSVSPLDLAISRRAWSDTLFGFIGLAMIYSCCEITRNRNRIIWYILLIALGSYCLLIKELGLIVYGLCLIWIFWILWIKEKSFFKGVLFLTFSFLAALIGYSIFSHKVGGFAPVIQVMNHIKEGLPNNIYAIRYQSGPWYYFLQGFWIISPLNTFLFLIGFIGTIFSNAGILKTRRSILGIIYFTVVFMLFSLAIPYSQNFRYISVLYAPFYLIGGLGLWYIILSTKVIAKNLSFYIVSVFFVVIILLGAIHDYQSFQKIFAKTGIIDLSIRLVRECSL